MSRSTHPTTERKMPRQSGEFPMGTRIDPAHLPAGSVAEDCREDLLQELTSAHTEEGVEQPESSSVDLHQQQAEQLAGYLRARQRDLDKREAKLNAHLAQLDTGVRNARLWVTEREAALEQREAEVVARQDRLAMAEAAAKRILDTSERELAAREVGLRQPSGGSTSGARADTTLDEIERLAAHETRYRARLAELKQREGELRRREKKMHEEASARENAAKIELAGRRRELDDREKHLRQALRRQERAARETVQVEANRQTLAAWESELKAMADDLAVRAAAFEVTMRTADSSHEPTKTSPDASAEQQARQVLRRAKEQAATILQQAELGAERILAVQQQQSHARRNELTCLTEKMLSDLDRRRQADSHQLEQLRIEARKPAPELLARQEEVQRGSQEIDERRGRLDAYERSLDESHAEVTQLRAELDQQRESTRKEARAERRRLAIEHRRGMRELEENRQSLARRGEQVDQCRVSIEQLRAELGLMHRETLEIRLATEELWSRLSGTASPKALTGSLAKIRAKLAEHYRLTNVRLTQKREELAASRVEMVRQHDALVHQKQEWQDWTDERRSQIEQQAERLVTREQSLEQQEAEFKQLARQWQSERLRYEQIIRRLKNRLEAPV